MEEKSVEEFYLAKKETGRRQPDCKNCFNEKKKQHYAEGGEERKAKSREYAKKTRAKNREADNAKKYAWREANPEKAKAIHRRAQAKRVASGKIKAYREANKEKIRQKNAEYRAAHKEEIAAWGKAYYRNNKARIKAWHQEYREANPEQYKAMHSRWKSANKATVNTATQRRRAIIAGCSEHHTTQEWEDLKKAANYTCLWCGKQEPEIQLTRDHVVPLSKGGSNTIANIQGLCKSCNSKKHTDDLDFRTPPAVDSGSCSDKL